MKRSVRLRSVLVAALLLAAPARGEDPPGVVVEDAAGATTALRPGDVLRGWEREGGAGARGELRGLLDFRFLQVEESARGAIAVVLDRGPERLRVAMPPPPWRVDVRPRFVGEEADRLAAGLGLLGEGRWEEGELRLREAARGLAGAGRPREAAEVLLLLARRLQAAKRKGSVEPVLSAALALPVSGRERGDLAVEAGRIRVAVGDPDGATRAFAEASALYRAAGAPLAVAYSANFLGIVAWQAGCIDEAAGHFQESLDLTHREVPGSLAEASAVTNVANVANRRSRLDEAELGYLAALQVYDSLPRRTLRAANSLNNLGVVRKDRGDLDGAERAYREALEIHLELDPEGREIPVLLSNIGGILHDRGDLAGAERFQLRALERQERLGPESVEMVALLRKLADVGESRRNVEAVELHAGRALAITERIAPGSLDLADVLAGIARLHLRVGRYDTAEEATVRALEIHGRLAPGGRAESVDLERLARIALARGDAERAAELFACAEGWPLREAPDSLDRVTVLDGLAESAQRLGRLADAERWQAQSLEICRRLAPGTASEARALHRFGHILRERREPEAALAVFVAAIDTLETQIRRLGGGDLLRSNYRADFQDLYREPIGLLLELSRPGEAFDLLERSRAQGFLTLLAQRDLRSGEDLPAELDRERRAAEAEYRALLGELGGGPPAGRAELLRRLQEARVRVDELDAKAWRLAPRRAELESPAVLGHDAIAGALGPGTLLLSYSLGPERGELFLLEPGGGPVEVVPVGAGLDALRGLVSRFRLAIEAGGATRDEAVVRRLASRLSELLLAPVAGRLETARRLVVVPDGPLHLLPWGALADPTGGSPRWLVERLPVTVAASATAFASLSARRSGEGPDAFLAFGDPVYRGEGDPPPPSDPALREGRRGELRFEPLPATRDEVLGAAEAFGARARTWLGEEATEERVRETGPDAGVLHLACHGFVDPEAPLESGLALSRPRAGAGSTRDGLLQAWEVLEDLRLEADLVVLSACQTALGREIAGEGVIGLTRAFQLAGARSVVASLWSVSDESTARLMQRFYRHRAEGTGKDEALRLAQLDLVRSTGPTSHPFFWAPFELFGDFR